MCPIVWHVSGHVSDRFLHLEAYGLFLPLSCGGNCSLYVNTRPRTIVDIVVVLALAVASVEPIDFELAVASVGLIVSDLGVSSFASSIPQDAVGAI